MAYLAGCDGARSTVREQLGTAYRGTSSDRRYVVADVSATGPAAAPPGSGAFSFCLSRDDFLLVVPARPDGTSRFVGLLPVGLDGGDVGSRTSADFAEATTGTRVEAVHWFSTYGVTHRVADHLRDGPGVPAGRRRARAQPAGRAGDEHRRRRRGEPGLEARRGPAGPGRVVAAGQLRGRAAAVRPPAGGDHRPRLRPGRPAPGRRARLARQLLFRVLLPAVLATRAGAAGRPGTAVGQIRLRLPRLAAQRRAGRAGSAAATGCPGSTPPTARDTHAAAGPLDWQVHVHGDGHPGVRRRLRASGGWPSTGGPGRRRPAGPGCDATPPTSSGRTATSPSPTPAQDPARLAAHLDRRDLRPRSSPDSARREDG